MSPASFLQVADKWLTSLVRLYLNSLLADGQEALEAEEGEKSCNFHSPQCVLGQVRIDDV